MTGFRWFQMVSDGFRWFQIISCFSKYARISDAVIYCQKTEYEFFEFYVLLWFFFRSDLERHGDIEACTSMKTHRRENVKLIVTNYKDKFKLNLHYNFRFKVQLLAYNTTVIQLKYNCFGPSTWAPTFWTQMP